VTKNPQKPFVIETNAARIQVLGTSFNVNTIGKNRVEVLVKTGIVSLSSNQNSKDMIYLKKGDYGVVEAGKVSPEKTPGANYLSWQTKKFQFNNDQLKEVTDILSRAYAKRIVLADDSMETARLTSTYNQASLNTIIQSLCLTFHLKATQNNNEIVLSSAD
jgi:ferric-dicitrate binding protein FerR (iron transport regulator)